MTRRVESFSELAGRVLAGPARLGGARLVAVDGGTGAGKTTFAARLARAVLGAGRTVEVVHTDDLLDGWDDQFTFWPRLADTVLTPLSRGEPALCPVYDWHARSFSTLRPVPVVDVLIVEGVSAARRAGAGVRTLSIFLDLDPETRLSRALERDGGAQIEAELRTWLAREERWYAVDRTAQHADLVVDAGAGVGHHPEGEYQLREVNHG